MACRAAGRMQENGRYRLLPLDFGEVFQSHIDGFHA
jgi:hypothetical protein